jgi:hypothetical protein
MPATACSTMLAQRLWPAVPARAPSAAILRRGMLRKSEGMASLQIPAEVPKKPQWTGKTTRTIPAPAEASGGCKIAGKQGSEGNPKEVFSGGAATGLAVTKDSRKRGVLPHNASVVMNAGEHSNVCWSGSGAGESAEQSASNIQDQTGGQFGVHDPSSIGSCFEIVLTYCASYAIFLSSRLPTKERKGERSNPPWCPSFSLLLRLGMGAKNAALGAGRNPRIGT